MDVLKSQSFTLHKYFDLKSFTLPLVNLGTADASGLVPDPNNPSVRYRPGVVGLLPSQPEETPQYHTYNWGGYGSVQAKPQATQIIDDHASTVSGVDGGETLILPTQGAPGLQSAQAPVQLPVINLENADTSGLVSDPRSGVSYRPGVLNIDASQPAGTPEVHNINWGGYGSVQAAPQPTQIVDDHYSTFSTTDSAEIFISPANNASTSASAQLTSINSNVAQSSVLQIKGETVDAKA